MKTKSKFKDRGSKGEYTYKSRGRGAVERRANQQGGNFEPMYKGDIKLFKPHDGENRVRMMPPEWDDAEHWGCDVWVHSNIGPNNQRIICPEKHHKGKCAVCVEWNRLTAEGDKQGAYDIRPVRRVAVWLIDRAKQSEGPMLWPMPWQVDKDVSGRCKDRESGEYVEADHPEKGYDFFFVKTGVERNTKYEQVERSSKATPLSDKPERMRRWLAFTKAHPIPELLIIHDEEFLKRMFDPVAEADEREERGTRSERTGKPKSKKIKKFKKLDDIDKPAKTGKKLKKIKRSE